jgi:hypothetical protein
MGNTSGDESTSTPAGTRSSNHAFQTEQKSDRQDGLSSYSTAGRLNNNLALHIQKKRSMVIPYFAATQRNASMDRELLFWTPLATNPWTQPLSLRSSQAN